MPETVLVVDDNPVNVVLLDRILRTQHYQVQSASDAAGALAAIRRQAPDALLLDVKMPGMSGFELASELKRNPDTWRIPILLVTGYSQPEDHERAQQAGADDIISKPIHGPELLTRVRMLLSLRRAVLDLDGAETALLALARRIEGRNRFKIGHGERLAFCVGRLAERLGWPPEERRALERAAALHDIGHIATPEAMLLKKGKLTAKEWDVVRRHPAAGEEMCAPVRPFAASLPIIRHHHERLDGSGYPDGLRGDAIPRGARLFSLADAYDALTTARSYRAALPPARALVQLWREVERGWWEPAYYQALSAEVAAKP
ncbi:MAG TPA: HD domain-containing phosphohydrolase [Terriglobales bacterium]|nr:HD domain-containing phosphohydrolase [Terriglobales bacterium]